MSLLVVLLSYAVAAAVAFGVIYWAVRLAVTHALRAVANPLPLVRSPSPRGDG